jgi:hypothetical protein
MTKINRLGWRTAARRRPPLATLLLCLYAALFPTPLRAGQIGLGLGYVRGDCGITQAADSGTCFRGARSELLVNFFEKDRGSVFGKSSSDASTSDGRRSGRASGAHLGDPGFSSFGGGGDIRGALILLAVIIVVFGIYWSIAALASQKLKLGLYYSYDFQSSRWPLDGDAALERYRVSRAGLQAGFYLIPDVDVQLHVGVGPAVGKLETADGRYDLRGVSSKVGLGYVPSTDAGPFALYEFEGTFFSGQSLQEHLHENQQLKLPKVRRTGALMGGYTFAF